MNKLEKRKIILQNRLTRIKNKDKLKTGLPKFLEGKGTAKIVSLLKEELKFSDTKGAIVSMLGFILAVIENYRFDSLGN
jgi:hypothetical protein